MKRVIVMRHAEAGQARTDLERPLTQHGESQARETAQKLKELGVNPDCLLVSPALRTRETAYALLDVFGLPDSICRYEKSIYEAGTEQLRDALSNLPEDVSEIIMIGHNPGVSSLVSGWSGDYYGFPVGMAVVMESDAELWSTLFYSKGRVLFKACPEY